MKLGFQLVLGPTSGSIVLSFPNLTFKNFGALRPLLLGSRCAVNNGDLAAVLERRSHCEI